MPKPKLDALTKEELECVKLKAEIAQLNRPLRNPSTLLAFAAAMIAFGGWWLDFQFRAVRHERAAVQLERALLQKEKTDNLVKSLRKEADLNQKRLINARNDITEARKEALRFEARITALKTDYRRIAESREQLILESLGPRMEIEDVATKVKKGRYRLLVKDMEGMPVSGAEVCVRLHASIGGLLCPGETDELGIVEFDTFMDGFVPRFLVKKDGYETHYEALAKERMGNEYAVVLRSPEALSPNDTTS